jgi:hypothetical protein
MWMIRSFFYWFISQFAQAPFLHHFTGFGIIYDRTMIELVRKLKNPQLFSRAFVSELNPARLYFNQPKRRAGRSKSDIKHLFNTALLLLTQSTKIGSRVALFVGTIVSAISALVGLVYLIMKLLFWSSFPAGIIPLTIGVFFLGSIQIFFIGLLGEYVTAINEKLDARPYAIEAERINFDEPERPERVPF